jgi:hypothetical protein
VTRKKYIPDGVHICPTNFVWARGVRGETTCSYATFMHESFSVRGVRGVRGGGKVVTFTHRGFEVYSYDDASRAYYEDEDVAVMVAMAMFT